jgi:hypothetical protein
MIPPLVVIAFDEVGPEDRSVTLRAATEPLDGSDVRWGGRELFFEEVKGLLPGTSGTTRKIGSDEKGMALVNWRFPATAATGEFEVRYLDERQLPPWSERDQGHVFFWNSDARVLAVDVEPLVNEANSAALALRVAAEKGWNIAYLATSADRPLDYRKQRSKLQQLNALVPKGPVLARKTFYQGTSQADARKEVLAELKRYTRGVVVYVSAENGITLWTVAGDGILTGPLAVEAWPQLNSALPQ